MAKVCLNCGDKFPYVWRNPATGRKHNLGNRKFCIKCSPFLSHNTSITMKRSEDLGEKLCKRCNSIKPSEEFYLKKSRNGLTAYCKVCTNLQTMERQRRLKAEAIQYKGGKCIYCGYHKCSAALEFHHRDPQGKDFTISNCKCTSFEKIRCELDKCDLVCSNCHREIHRF